MSSSALAWSKKLFSGSIHELKAPPKSQVPFLDGLRTIAILLVINGHVAAHVARAYGQNLYSRFLFVRDGWVGVDLFFVLSGYFIGSQLWKELQNTGTISLRDFMIRRGLRIWPLYFFTFFCVLALSGRAAAGKSYGWSDLLFVTNYVNRGLVMGSWSLCTEEQFYIVTPLALILLAPLLGTVLNFRPWLWSAMGAVALFRSIYWVHATGHFFSHDPEAFSKLYYPFHTHCDGLLAGLLISSITALHETPEWLKRRGLVLVGGLTVFAVLWRLQHEVLAFSALAVLFGSVVWFGLNARLMIFKPKIFYWISRLSFGMYLNHEYLLPWIAGSAALASFRSHLVRFTLLSVLTTVVLSAIIALGTYCVVEWPFLKLRSHILRNSCSVPRTHDISRRS